MALRRSCAAGPPLLDHQLVGVVRQLADVLRGDARVVDRDLGVGNGVGQLGRAVGEHLAGLVEILQDVGDRILVLVAQQLGQPLGQALDALHQLRRAVEQRPEAAGARRDDRAALRPGLGNRRAAAACAVELDLVHSGKADAVDLRGRPLQDRGLVVDVDPHPHELRPRRQQRDFGHLADRNAGEGDVATLVEAADRLGEINVVAFGRLVGEAGQPDDEQQHPDEQRHGHGSDHHIVRPRFHQAFGCSTSS